MSFLQFRLNFLQFLLSLFKVVNGTDGIKPTENIVDSAPEQKTWHSHHLLGKEGLDAHTRPLRVVADHLPLQQWKISNWSPSPAAVTDQ